MLPSYEQHGDNGGKENDTAREMTHIHAGYTAISTPATTELNLQRNDPYYNHYD